MIANFVDELISAGICDLFQNEETKPSSVYSLFDGYTFLLYL